MKKSKWMKGVAVAAIAAMSVGMLAGCGNGNSQQEEKSIQGRDCTIDAAWRTGPS